MTACSSSAMATIWRRVTRKARRPRSACATVPMLVAVLRVDSRWAPSSRTRRATPISMCTHYASDTGVEAWRMVSWVSARRGCGGRGACEHSERRAAMNQGRLGSRARSVPSTACRRSCSSRRLLAACAWVMWVARACEVGLEIQCEWYGHGAGQAACDALARVARGEGPTARFAGVRCLTRYGPTRVKGSGPESHGLGAWSEEHSAPDVALALARHHQWAIARAEVSCPQKPRR